LQVKNSTLKPVCVNFSANYEFQNSEFSSILGIKKGQTMLTFLFRIKHCYLIVIDFVISPEFVITVIK
jgi:hypothetical protein